MTGMASDYVVAYNIASQWPTVPQTARSSKGLIGPRSKHPTRGFLSSAGVYMLIWLSAVETEGLWRGPGFRREPISNIWISHMWSLRALLIYITFYLKSGAYGFLRIASLGSCAARNNRWWDFLSLQFRGIAIPEDRNSRIPIPEWTPSKSKLNRNGCIIANTSQKFVKNNAYIP